MPRCQHTSLSAILRSGDPTATSSSPPETIELPFEKCGAAVPSYLTR